MDSDFLQPHQHQHHHQQMNSGLTRFQSAPSSYLSSFLEGGNFGGDPDQLLNPRALSPETERVFRRFMCFPQDSTTQNSNNATQNCSGNEFLQSQNQNQQKHFQVQMNGGYSSVSHMGCPSQQDGSNIVLDSSYRAENSDRLSPMNTDADGGGGRGGLIRHSSSPAGLFSNIDVEGYGVMRGMGSYGAGNSTNAEASSYSRRLKNQMDYSPRSPSSSAHLPEIRTKSLGNEESLGENHRNDGGYPRGFQIGWEDIAIDSFLSGVRENDKRKFSSMSESDNQSGDGGNRPSTGLTHHLSLPKSSAELPSMEKLLQLQDSVPCQVRAKRGCATHPRSIAERVRRTKISERMRKLQELVPNMDKQTNTADMLDLAVDYIKDLQKQVERLSDNCAKCTCSGTGKP